MKLSNLPNYQFTLLLDFYNELKTYHLSYFSIYKHYAIKIADGSSMQDRSPWSLCGSVHVVRASERGIRRSEVRLLVGTHNFPFVPRSWRHEKNIFL